MATPNHNVYPGGPPLPPKVPFSPQLRQQNTGDSYSSNQQYFQAPQDSTQQTPLGQPLTHQPNLNNEERQWNNRNSAGQLRGSRSVAGLNSSYTSQKQPLQGFSQRQATQPLGKHPGRRPPPGMGNQYQQQVQNNEDPNYHQSPRGNPSGYNSPRLSRVISYPEQQAQQLRSHTQLRTPPLLSKGAPHHQQQYQQRVPPPAQQQPQPQPQGQPQYQPQGQPQYQPQGQPQGQGQFQYNQPPPPQYQSPVRSQSPQSFRSVPPRTQYPSAPPQIFSNKVINNGSQESLVRPPVQKSSTFPISESISDIQSINSYHSRPSISSIPPGSGIHNSNPSVSSSGTHRSYSTGSESGSAHPIPHRQYVEDSNIQNIGPVDPSKPPSENPEQLQYVEFDRLRLLARNNPHDNDTQFKYAKALVEAIRTLADKIDTNGHLITHGTIDSKEKRKNREHWATQSLKILRRLSNSQHHAPAMFFLGTLYGTGVWGLEKDYEKAYELYQKAAKMDYGPAMYRTAVCNEVGAGTRRDNYKAITWLKKAAAKGEGAAMYKLGMINLYGLMGLPRSFAEAVQWLKRAAQRADAENPHSLHEIGRLYESADTIKENHNSDSSQIIPHDDAKALDYYLQAAKLGYSPSQYKLGWCYEYGELGCPIDPKRSIGWYSRAAAQGEAESAMALSGWYLTGADGVLTPSDTEAYLWARKAAEKGLAKAEYALGYFSEVGLGVKADLEEAKLWYYKAASQKHPKAIKKIKELRNLK